MAVAFGEDPELVETFRAEVAERLAALSAGLLTLPRAARPREAVTVLCRDAHTVKGSARMLGLDEIVAVAHRAEDALVALRDGRVAVSDALVEALLAACDAIAAGVPGVAIAQGSAPRPAEAVAALDALLDRPGQPAPRAPDPQRPAAFLTATAPLGSGAPRAEGEGAPRLVVASNGDSGGAPPGARTAEAMRISTARVHALLDAIGEAELGGRRVARSARSALGAARAAAQAAAEAQRGGAAGRLTRLVAALEEAAAASAAACELAEDHRDQLALVREEAVGLAMVPVGQLLAGYPRLVRNIARRSGKAVSLELEGQDVELDKQVLDAVTDALTHLVTNAVDHGVEGAAERVAAGKAPAATVTVTARSAGGTVTLEVADDGRGIDYAAVRSAARAAGVAAADSADVTALLFTPAVSTAAEVSETSGRGMGLDAVRAAVEGLGGTVAVSSDPGNGTAFTLTVPVTLGVLHCLIVRLGAERYAVPISAVVETVALGGDARVGGAPVLVRDGRTVPLIDLAVVLEVSRDAGEAGQAGGAAARVALITRHGAAELAWAVEAVDGECELVVGDVGPFLARRVPGIGGVTIDADGRVVCVLELREVAARLGAGAGGAGGGRGQIPAPRQEPAQVLVVEDSVGVRELERAVLEAAGYRVETAVDGSEGAARLLGAPADLVLTDVEMPGLDGFELTRRVRSATGWESVPVVIMTSCGSDGDRREGLLAGASAYLLKSEFDQAQLVDTVRRLVGR